MPVAGCSSCSGDVSLEVAQMMRYAQAEQTAEEQAVASANASQLNPLRIDSSDAAGVAERLDIMV